MAIVELVIRLLGAGSGPSRGVLTYFGHAGPLAPAALAAQGGVSFLRFTSVILYWPSEEEVDTTSSS